MLHKQLLWVTQILENRQCSLAYVIAAALGAWRLFCAQADILSSVRLVAQKYADLKEQDWPGMS